MYTCKLYLNIGYCTLYINIGHCTVHGTLYSVLCTDLSEVTVSGLVFRAGGEISPVTSLAYDLLFPLLFPLLFSLLFPFLDLLPSFLEALQPDSVGGVGLQLAQHELSLPHGDHGVLHTETSLCDDNDDDDDDDDDYHHFVLSLLKTLI